MSLDAYIIALKSLPSDEAPETFGMLGVEVLSLKDVVDAYKTVVTGEINLVWNALSIVLT